MTQHRHWLVWIALACGACGGDDGSAPPPPDATPDPLPPGTVTLTGTITGTAPAEGHVVGLWSVDVGPDRIDKFGDGSATATTFDLVIPKGKPPDEALNVEATAKWGVGLAVLIPAGDRLSDGTIAKQPTVLGMSTQFAVVYRKGDVVAGSLFTWINAFPNDQLACGKCVKATTVGAFDTLVPIDCSALVLDAADPSTLTTCNWI